MFEITTRETQHFCCFTTKNEKIVCCLSDCGMIAIYTHVDREISILVILGYSLNGEFRDGHMQTP